MDEDLNSNYQVVITSCFPVKPYLNKLWKYYFENKSTKLW